MSNGYLDPVPSVWSRIGGIVLLVAGAALTAQLVYSIVDLLIGLGPRRTMTSSTLIFGLILLALCGICWQAGYRLAFQRPDRNGTLFSRPAWFAIGAGLLVITGLMTLVILRARRPTLLDGQVLLFLGGIGVWCLALAIMRGGDTR